VSETTANVIVKVEIPRELYQIYERQSQQAGKPVEELMSQRLSDCKWYTSLNPIYLDDEFRAKLESLLSRSIRSAKDLVDYLAKSQSLRLPGGVRLSLPDSLLKRLETRKFGWTLAQVIEREAKHGLESYVGLR